MDQITTLDRRLSRSNDSHLQIDLIGTLNLDTPKEMSLMNPGWREFFTENQRAILGLKTSLFHTRNNVRCLSPLSLALHRDSGFKPDPLPLWVSPVIASSVLSWWGVFCVWTPEPDPTCSGDAAGTWGLALSPSTCTSSLGLAFCALFDTAFLRASWMALSMSAFRSFRAEVSGFDGALLGCSGRDKGNFSSGWACCKSNRHGKLQRNQSLDWIVQNIGVPKPLTVAWIRGPFSYSLYSMHFFHWGMYFEAPEIRAEFQN